MKDAYQPDCVCAELDGLIKKIVSVAIEVDKMKRSRIKYGDNLICDYCGSHIKRKVYKSERRKHTFCNKKCCDEYKKGKPGKKRNGVIIKCKLCGKERYVIKSQVIESGNFCSRECLNKYKTIHKCNQHLRKRKMLKCKVCKKHIYVKHSRVNRTKYCSKTCQALGRIKSQEHKRMVTNNKTRKRRALRKQINDMFPYNSETITRDVFNHKCHLCGDTENLCIDHYYPLSKGHKLTLLNAIILCKSCNSKKHAKNPIDFFELNIHVAACCKMLFAEKIEKENRERKRVC